MLKEYDDLVILWVTFDSKMTLESHLCSVSRAASQRLNILSKSWQVFHDRLLLGRCFRGFVQFVFEFCSAVWCSAANAHLKLLNRVVSGASFLTGGAFEWDLAHRQSVTVLCMLYEIRCNTCQCRMWRYTYAPPRCRTSQYRRTFIHLTVYLWNGHGGPIFDGVGLTGFKSRANAFLSA